MDRGIKTALESAFDNAAYELYQTIKVNDKNISVLNSFSSFNDYKIPVINKESSESNGWFFFDFSILDTEKRESRFIKNIDLLKEGKERKQRIEEGIKKLGFELEKISDEPDSYYPSENIFDKMYNTYSDVISDIVQKIYLNNYHRVNILLGICNIFKRYDFEELNPWGQSTIIGLLNHKNDAVKESALSVIENWENPEMISILENIDCSKSWMKKYISDIVAHLRII